MSVQGKHFPTIFVSHKRSLSYILPAFDAYVGNQLLLEGVWMEREVQFFKRLLKPGDVVIDAG